MAGAIPRLTEAETLLRFRRAVREMLGPDIRVSGEQELCMKLAEEAQAGPWAFCAWVLHANLENSLCKRNWLLSASFMRQYKEWLTERAYNAEMEAACDLRNLAAEMNYRSVLEEVLMDHSVSITALARYLVAMKAGLLQGAEEFRPKACRQLRVNPYLFGAWRDYEPFMPLAPSEVLP